MFLKVPLIIIMRFGENIVLGPKDIDIYEFWGGIWRMYMGDVHFLFIIEKKRKKYKSMTYTKIKFYIILI